MPNTRSANAVRLEFKRGRLVRANLSGAADDEADLEGMAVADGHLWVVGSHGLKRKNAKPGREHADNAKRLAKVSLDANRRLLACLPIEADKKGEPCLVRQAEDGRRALRLKGDAETNLLTRALADDPHFGPYMAIPGKDNGFDIEGLAVDGNRLLFGLRGPVLRGWSALLEIAVEAHAHELRLLPLDDHGTLIRKHFLQLDGLGVRDLHFTEAVSLDSTSVKVHPDGTGALKKTARSPLASPAAGGTPRFIWLPRMLARP